MHGDTETDHVALASAIEGLHHTTLEIRYLVLQRWTVLFYISARSSDVTLEAAEKDRT